MGKNEIPGRGFWDGCAIAVRSEQQIWLIGGAETGDRILCFDVEDPTFEILSSKLGVKRSRPRCAFILNTNKVMVTGGRSSDNYLNSSEIIDTEDGSATKAFPMYFKRAGHGIGIVMIGQEKLIVFGGKNERGYVDNVEVYNTQTKRSH